MPLPNMPPDRPPADDSVFKSIPGLSGYIINPAGRVMSCRKGAWKELRWQHYKAGSEDETKGPYVALYNDQGKQKPHTIRKLVALTFLGPRPPGHILLCKARGGCHLDDLFYWNEKVGGRSSAVLCRIRRGRQTSAKLTDPEVIDIRREVNSIAEAGKPIPWEEIGARYKVTGETIKNVARCKVFGHVDAGVPPWIPPPKKKPSNAKITADTARTIKVRLAAGESIDIIRKTMADLGVTSDIVEMIKYGKTWTKV